MKVHTTRFGQIEIRRQDVITFPRGLIGFPHLKRYVLLDHPGGGPFRWLQAVEEGETAFVVTDPLIFFPDYRISVTVEELSEIRITDPADGVVVVILVVPKDPYQITANLRGPVVINAKERLGLQLVLDVPQYTTRHFIFSKEEVPQGT